jgi:hypothetical protein
MPGMNRADATRELLRPPSAGTRRRFTSSGPAEFRQAFLDAGASEVFRKEHALRLRDYLCGPSRRRLNVPRTRPRQLALSVAE